MVERFLDIMDERKITSRPFRDFENEWLKKGGGIRCKLWDFENEWLKKGEEFGVNYVDVSSPVKINSRKRKLEDTEDSLLVTKRRELNDEINQEESLLTGYRFSVSLYKRHPIKYGKLEERLTDVSHSEGKSRRVSITQLIPGGNELKEPKYSAPLSPHDMMSLHLWSDEETSGSVALSAKKEPKYSTPKYSAPLSPQDVLPLQLRSNEETSGSVTLSVCDRGPFATHVSTN